MVEIDGVDLLRACQIDPGQYVIVQASVIAPMPGTDSTTNNVELLVRELPTEV